jgi:hypothetical protein
MVDDIRALCPRSDIESDSKRVREIVQVRTTCQKAQGGVIFTRALRELDLKGPDGPTLDPKKPSFTYTLNMMKIARCILLVARD